MSSTFSAAPIGWSIAITYPPNLGSIEPSDRYPLVGWLHHGIGMPDAAWYLDDGVMVTASQVYSDEPCILTVLGQGQAFDQEREHRKAALLGVAIERHTRA